MNVRKNTPEAPQRAPKRDRAVFFIALAVILALVVAALVYKHKREEASRPGYEAPFEEVDVTLDTRPGAKKHSILIISVAALRPDHLSIYGYGRKTSQNIDAFFGKCTHLYERAYSTEVNAAPSLVSILSGLYPLQHKVRLLYQLMTPSVPLLPDYLRPLGYQSAAVVPSTALTDEATALAERFDHYDDHVDEQTVGGKSWTRRASRNTNAALDWLTSKRKADSPHLLWVHYTDPHPPYRPPADEWENPFTHEGEKIIDLSMVHERHRLDGIVDGLSYVDAYDSEIAYTDRAIGRLLEGYEKAGLLDETIVVFTADFGQTMMEHGRYFTHGYHVWEPIVRVPLLIRTPECHTGRTPHPVSLVDVTPTLLDMLGQRIPSGRFDGVLLEERGPQDIISLEATLHGMGTHRALLRGHRKWHAFIHASGAVVSREYVDLKANPNEDKLTEWPETGGELLDQWIEADKDPAAISFTIKRGKNLTGPKKAPE